MNDMRLPLWVSNVAAIILACIGVFFLLFAWMNPDVAQAWVIATGGLALIIFVVTVRLFFRIKDLEDKIEQKG
jgi:hypothetical protein